jgi:hypothetical protein
VPILEQIAPLGERFLHPDIPVSTLDRFDMAALYATAGRTGEAIAAAKWGVADRERRFGPVDPLTIAARTLLADLYQSAGRADEAAAVLEQPGAQDLPGRLRQVPARVRIRRARSAGRPQADPSGQP